MKGILYNTNIQEPEDSDRFYFQCSFCGKMMTDAVFRQIMDYIDRHGVPPMFTPEIKVKKDFAMRKRRGRHRKKLPPVREPGFMVGVVKDKVTGEAVPNAYVYLKGIGIEGFTNSYGQFSIEPVPEMRKVILEVSKPGYLKKARIFKSGVKKGEVKKLRVELRQKGRDEEEIPELIPQWGRPKKGPDKWGIHGFVMDSNREPVQFAVVVIMGRDMTYVTETSADGHYQFIGIIQDGVYPVKVTADGYNYDRRWVRVSKKGMVTCDFMLSPMIKRA